MVESLYGAYSRSRESGPNDWAPVTFDADFSTMAKALLVLEAGTVVAVTGAGNTRTFANCPAGLIIPGEFSQVTSASTVAAANVHAALDG